MPYLNQGPECQEFLPKGKYQTWIATEQDLSRIQAFAPSDTELKKLQREIRNKTLKVLRMVKITSSNNAMVNCPSSFSSALVFSLPPSHTTLCVA